MDDKKEPKTASQPMRDDRKMKDAFRNWNNRAGSGKNAFGSASCRIDKLFGRFRGSEKKDFGSASCRLELLEKKQKFIMGTTDGGRASGEPEFCDGTFKIAGNTLGLSATRKYWAEDEWGYKTKKELGTFKPEGKPFVFRLKILHSKKGIELVTEYPQKITLRRVDAAEKKQEKR